MVTSRGIESRLLVEILMNPLYHENERLSSLEYERTSEMARILGAPQQFIPLPVPTRAARRAVP